MTTTQAPRPIQTQASLTLKRILSQDAKSHTGKLGAPVWRPPVAPTLCKGNHGSP